MDDASLARSIAVEAGELLKKIRLEAQCSKPELGKRADREANDLILARLVADRPDDFVLSEETVDDKRRCSSQRVWIVDPLDGTKEYSEGRDDWAVHIGLAINGVAGHGAVAVPMQNKVFATSDPVRISSAWSGAIRIVVSRTRPPDVAKHLAGSLSAELIPMGSAGAKAMAVVDGSADIYLHEGGQFEWDNCAPAAVALAAGFHASRLDGSALAYNCHDPRLPDLLICRPHLASTVLAYIRKAARL